jgi:fibronectin type 3 domain-containing protein
MRKRILLGLMAVAALAAACSNSGSPASVDTVAPAAILDLEARVVGNTIEVTWTAGAEADLVGYRVYRSSDGAASALVAVPTVPWFVDVDVAAAHIYAYEITSVDDAGNESPRVSSGFLALTGAEPQRGQGRD